ncbi:ABC transporter substrate-binding protein [Mesorhizobium sp. CGMCC 1.15528]|uniref:ABC transporter substrate-binding protein n=1 Tax=Mesorhizobium zhangyense TaxID=1776730 RepID=A0A7C9RAE2_9HYPH|nr:substrate-binding domain-containing protein [Mesorhizobium zhangyense]NGN43876.1 ABC transporter substrate-binding protein [Mesorhizobium zhangyense]
MKETAPKIIYPVAVRALMKVLVPRLEAALGTPLDQAIDLNPAIAQRIADGERFDVGLTNPHFVSALITKGHIGESSHRAFGRVPLAIGRREGGFVPVVTSVRDIISLINDAESIGYTAAGTSGQTYLQVMERLRLTEMTKSTSRPMGTGEPMAAVAAGDVQFGVVPLTTVLSAAGVVPAAIFPDDLGAHIDISVFLSHSPHERAALILKFLTSPEIDAELATAGMSRFAFT